MNRREVGLREFGRATDGRGPVATGVVRQASPVLAEGVERFIFADVFSRSGLSARERELITVTVLAAIGGADNQLGVHVPAALRCGADPEELLQLCEQIAPYCGFPRALNALRAVRAVLDDRGIAYPAAVTEVDLGDHGTLTTDVGEGDDGDLLLHAPELDRRAWRDVVTAMGDRRVVAPDLRGTGAAVGAPVADGPDRLVADLLGVMDAVGLATARVVTLGASAALGAALAQAAPDRVRSLVLVGPLRPGAAGGDPATGGAPDADDMARWLLPRTLAADPWGARYVRDRVERLDAEGWAGLLRALGPVDPTDTGGRPVRLILGEHDALVEHEAVAVAWLGATLEHIPGAGHLVPVEAPGHLAETLAR